MLRASLLLAAALLGAGCVESFVPTFARSGVSDWSYETERSMAPDFTGEGETFPVLLVHQHHVPSQRQQEAWREVVCSTTDDDPLVVLRPSAESAAMCAPPPADAATGRIFLERAEFDAQRPEAVVVTPSACGGSVVILDEARRELDIGTPGHAFRIERHDNRTFSVDGRWIQPGTALKVSYYIARGSEEDEEFVRVVFDHPGEWLKSHVAPWSEALDGDVPPRPGEGSGLVVDVPLTASGPVEVVEAILAATPRPVQRIESLRVVQDGVRLTEATVRIGTAEGSITWYGAGRTGESLRMLGAQAPIGSGHGVAVDAIREVFDGANWTTLRATHDGAMTDVRLDPTTGWTTAGLRPVALDPALAPCGGHCVRILQTDPLGQRAWATLLAPQADETYDALTLHVLAFREAQEPPSEVWWHVR